MPLKTSGASPLCAQCAPIPVFEMGVTTHCHCNFQLALYSAKTKNSNSLLFIVYILFACITPFTVFTNYSNVSFNWKSERKKKTKIKHVPIFIVRTSLITIDIKKLKKNYFAWMAANNSENEKKNKIYISNAWKGKDSMQLKIVQKHSFIANGELINLSYMNLCRLSICVLYSSSIGGLFLRIKMNNFQHASKWSSRECNKRKYHEENILP